MATNNGSGEGSSSGSSSTWTWVQNKAFEVALAIHPEDTEDRWEKIATYIPGNNKSIEEIKQHYQFLVHDIDLIESGQVPLPDYESEQVPLPDYESEQVPLPSYPPTTLDYPPTTLAPTGNTTLAYPPTTHAPTGNNPPTTLAPTGNNAPTTLAPTGTNAPTALAYPRTTLAPTSNNLGKEKSPRGAPWTAEEHKQFLLGLEKFGKGEWKAISVEFVSTRTATQVASHAQKHYQRQRMTKDTKRKSIFDMTDPNDQPENYVSKRKRASRRKKPAEPANATKEGGKEVDEFNKEVVIVSDGDEGVGAKEDKVAVANEVAVAKEGGGVSKWYDDDLPLSPPESWCLEDELELDEELERFLSDYVPPSL